MLIHSFCVCLIVYVLLFIVCGGHMMQSIHHLIECGLYSDTIIIALQTLRKIRPVCGAT